MGVCFPSFGMYFGASRVLTKSSAWERIFHVIRTTLKITVSRPLCKASMAAWIEIFPTILFLCISKTSYKLQILIHLPLYIKIIRHLRIFRKIFRT